LNFTPSSTAPVSPESGVAGTALEGQIVHAVQLVAAGVTAVDGADSALVPTALVAFTVNVYAVPLVSPVMVVLVAGGVPVTVFGVPAVVPAYGVTV
jgi:hypothetical protein